MTQELLISFYANGFKNITITVDMELLKKEIKCRNARTLYLEKYIANFCGEQKCKIISYQLVK